MNLLDKCKKWFEEDKYQNIVDAILSLPEEKVTTELRSELARAYNNLDEYEKAIEVLLSLRDSQENTPLYHYRLGYAYFYLSYKEKDKAKQEDLILKARKELTRALILNPDKDTEEDCRYFLEKLVGRYKASEIFKEEKKEIDNNSPCQYIYDTDEMQAVEEHISKYFGRFENVLHEMFSPDVHIDICIIPPEDEADYYTLVTMGMGSYVMNAPEELKGDNLERAELMIALPSDWQVGSDEEKWYWPIRLLKMLARLPLETYSWLSWGHTIDYGEPYDKSVNFTGCILANPAVYEDEAMECVLPNGSIVNFYQVIPIYKEELDYKLNNGADMLFQRFADINADFVVDIERPNAVTDNIEHHFTMDMAQWHIADIHKKNLNVEEIQAYSHMAIYIRWCIEHNLMSDTFIEIHEKLIADIKNSKDIDIRPYFWNGLQLCLISSYFNDTGKAFAEYYYKDRDYPYYPSDIDDYALKYFGAEKYYSDEFQNEAYLFIPYDNEYYEAMSEVISKRFENWKDQKILDEKDEIVDDIIEYLDCECEYFPPMVDDDPITSAYSYNYRTSLKENYIPVLIVVDEKLYETLILNTSDDEEYNREKVKAYREKYLSMKVKSAKEIFQSLTDDKLKPFEIKEYNLEANNRFFSYWNKETAMTYPVILAKIPVKNPWEIFAYIPFGNWNDCPDTDIHISIAKYYYEKFKAYPAVISYDVLEYSLPEPVDVENLVETSLEHYYYCIDMEQNFKSIEEYADILSKSTKWYFWWD